MATTAHELETLERLVEYLATRLVSEPDKVVVRLSNFEDDTLELTVAQEDIGKVIGKQGKMIRALRLVVGAAAAKMDARVGLEIVEASSQAE